ncbi:MAG: phosphoglycerate dehydrogenase [Armatimonadetes bacterium]|nr:phosphoglycerate dehydrogenase [Armatimonadota bacterium]
MAFKAVVVAHSCLHYPPALDTLRQAGVQLVPHAEGVHATEDDLVRLVPGVHALVVGAHPVTARVLDAGTTLRVVVKAGVGVDNIDIPAATARGVMVASTPGTNADAVADYTWGLLIAASRGIVESDRLVRVGQWSRQIGGGVWGKTLGIVGLGTIGRRVALRARGFEMRVIACDVMPDHGWAAAHSVTFVPLERVLAEADFVTVHVPRMEGTTGLIGERELRLMQPTAFLVNTSRGGVIDEAALFRALREGWIAGAALDVFEEEPLPDSSPLRAAPRIILSPHNAGFSVEAVERTAREAVEAMLAALRGERPRGVWNPEVLERSRAR